MVLTHRHENHSSVGCDAETLRLLAGLLATGYLRLLAARAHGSAPPPPAEDRQIPVDSVAPPSDELAAGTPGRRP